MHEDTKLIEENIEAYLERHQNKELLRFTTVGSVDDGKSTLIGRLLHDTHGIYEDQLNAVKRASTKKGDELDLSLFTDGLKAEREQGITIDVAYRYFSTDKRKFIIADTPGHVQYTRNMATGASTANVAVILIDARLGVQQQSRRHAYIAALLGIPHLAVCVNKMDAVGYDRGVYERIREEFAGAAKRMGFKDVTFFPISALAGDNCVHESDRMPWHQGGALLEFLETVPIAQDRNQVDFRYPVQYVIRPHLDYRGFAAEIASGTVKHGDPILVLPSRKKSRVKSIDTYEGALGEAYVPMSVTLRLEDEIDISRGDMLVHPDSVPYVGQRFDAMMVWMSERALDRDKTYFLKHTTQLVRAEVEAVRYQTDLDTLETMEADGLELNDIGRVTVRCRRPIYYDPYDKNRKTGAFILVDSITNNTVAAGMILDPVHADPAPEAAEGPRRHRTQVSRRERHELLGQQGATVWLTGLPASGKTEIAYALERQLFDRGRMSLVVDPADELVDEEELGAVAPSYVRQIARRNTEAGLITIFAFASPTRDERASLRAGHTPDQWIEVYVATPIERCRDRDERGAYAGARPYDYEPPEAPAVEVSLDGEDAEQAAARIVSVLEQRGILAG